MLPMATCPVSSAAGEGAAAGGRGGTATVLRLVKTELLYTLPQAAPGVDSPFVFIMLSRIELFVNMIDKQMNRGCDGTYAKLNKRKITSPSLCVEGKKLLVLHKRGASY